MCGRPCKSAILPTDYKVICEHYDERNCTEFGDCAVTPKSCKIDSEKPPSCYVLWTKDERTGKGWTLIT